MSQHQFDALGALDEITAIPTGHVLRRRNKLHRSPEFSRDVFPFLFWGAFCAAMFFGGLAWAIALIDGLAQDTALAFVLMAAMIGGGLAGIFVEIYTIGQYFYLFDSNQDEIVGNLNPPEPPPGRGESHYWQQPGTQTFVMEPKEPSKGAMLKLMKALAIDGESPTIETARRCNYSRDDWANLRDWWIEREWIKWRDKDNPRQGAYLTEAGRIEFENRLQQNDT